MTDYALCMALLMLGVREWQWHLAWRCEWGVQGCNALARVSRHCWRRKPFVRD